MKSHIIISDTWPDGLPVVDEQYLRVMPSGGTQQQAYQEAIEKPVVSLTNTLVTGAELVGDIYWAVEGTILTITGDCALPDGDLIVMAEQVVDATNVVSDSRFKAVFLGGQLSITARFDKSGNYMITQERINRGLDRINSPVNLSFDKLEFDIYV